MPADDPKTSTETVHGYPDLAQYDEFEEIKRGPAKIVYRARNRETGDRVEITCFSPPPGADPQQWEQAVKKVRDVITEQQRMGFHANVQKLIEFGQSGDLLYMVSEYVEGRTLAQIINTEGPKSIDSVLPIFSHIAQVIDYAASFSLSHSGLNPYTILLRASDNTVCILDYGTARIRRKIASPYVAPEQLAGSEGDALADIYSMGAIMYTCLSGSVPFSGRSQAELGHKIQTMPPPPLRNHPHYVQDVIAKMMSKSPDQRYPVGIDVIQDLKNRRSPEALLSSPGSKTQSIEEIAQQITAGGTRYPYAVVQSDVTPVPAPQEHWDLRPRPSRTVAPFAWLRTVWQQLFAKRRSETSIPAQAPSPYTDEMLETLLKIQDRPDTGNGLPTTQVQDGSNADKGKNRLTRVRQQLSLLLQRLGFGRKGAIVVHKQHPLMASGNDQPSLETHAVVNDVYSAGKQATAESASTAPANALPKAKSRRLRRFACIAIGPKPREAVMKCKVEPRKRHSSRPCRPWISAK